MLYYKNAEIARKFKVSRATVGHWIDSAINKKNKLQLTELDGKFYISNTVHNKEILSTLSKKGQKFKNKSILKIISPTEEFFKVFDETQIVDIISNLEMYKEIPHKYTYFNGGAEYWDNYVKRTLKEGIENTVTNTHELLLLAKDYIFALIKNKKVNLVDIGVGNAYPVKELISNLVESDALRKYLALDMSPTMIDIAKQNIDGWFNGKVNFEGHTIDISSQMIRDLLFENSQYFENQNAINLVCFLGSSIENMEVNDHSLENIKKSMTKDDILVLGRTLDSESAITYFDFSETNPDEQEDTKWRWFIDALNLSEDLYEYEMLYDEKSKSRIGQMSLEVDLNMVFETPRFRKLISFRKGDKIVTWRHRHHSYKEIVEEMQFYGFEILSTATSIDKAQILVIAKLKV